MKAVNEVGMSFKDRRPQFATLVEESNNSHHDKNFDALVVAIISQAVDDYMEGRFRIETQCIRKLGTRTYLDRVKSFNEAVSWFKSDDFKHMMSAMDHTEFEGDDNLIFEHLNKRYYNEFFFERFCTMLREKNSNVTPVEGRKFLVKYIKENYIPMKEFSFS